MLAHIALLPPLTNARLRKRLLAFAVFSFRCVDFDSHIWTGDHAHDVGPTKSLATNSSGSTAQFGKFCSSF